MVKLTNALISEKFSSTPLQDLTSIDLSNNDISSLEDVSACISLRKLDLSHNRISLNEHLIPLKHSWKSLVHLNLSHNNLTSPLPTLSSLKNLKGRLIVAYLFVYVCIYCSFGYLK